MVWILLKCEFDEDERQWLRYHAKMPRFQMQAAQEETFLGFKSLLNIESLPHKSVRATNIACFIGYDLNHDIKSLEGMMESGMNIARLDTTITYKSHCIIVKNIRQAAKNYSDRLGAHFPIGIGIDTLGPTIRTGFIEGGRNKEIEIMTGTIIKLTSDPAYMYKCTVHVIYVEFENIFSYLTPKQTVYIDKGSIKLICQSIAGAFITCKVAQGGILGSQNSVSLPNIDLTLPIISDYDKTILDFAVTEQLDFVFCSFIADANAVMEIKRTLGERGKHIKLISKIETRESIKNLSGIIEISDAILIGRGDLCLEVTLPKLFIAQKYITAMCNRAGCPVVLAKELMESMQHNPLPTRAEVTDVANAIEDGVDMLMLSKETMSGSYMNTVIKIISQTSKESEAAIWRLPYNEWAFLNTEELDADNNLAKTVVNSSISVGAAAIFAITYDGKSAQLLSKYRPRCPILAITRNNRVARQCNLYRSIIPFLCEVPARLDPHRDIDAQVSAALNFGRKRDFIHPNDPIIVFIGNLKNNIYKNSMRIFYAEERLEIIDKVLYIH